MIRPDIRREETIILKTASSRWLAGVALAIVILAGVSVIIALLERRGEPSMLPDGTPEGAVQRYLLAVENGESDAAYGYLSPGTQETCDSQEFRESLRRFSDDGLNRRISGGRSISSGFSDSEDLRVTLVDTREVEGRTEVLVLITRFRVSPPFGADEYSHQESFVLEQTGGRWAFVEPPWPVRFCPQPDKPPGPERFR